MEDIGASSVVLEAVLEMVNSDERNNFGDKRVATLNDLPSFLAILHQHRSWPLSSIKNLP
jgi:hypothetical protein